MAKETGQAQELWGIRQACRAELRVYVSGIAGGDGGLGFVRYPEGCVCDLGLLIHLISTYS